MLDNNSYLNRYSINRRNLTLSLFPVYVRTLQEGEASNEVIDNADGNGNGDGVLSNWIIDELEKMCYNTADFEDIDDVINNEDIRLICCAAEEADDLHQDEHYQSSELSCKRIFEGSGLHDDVDEATVVQHQSTYDNGFDFLRDLPEAALLELFDYYNNGDSYSTTTSINAIATEREVAMTEPVQDTTTTMQSVVFLDNTTVDHKLISLHHTSDKSTAVKSSTTGTVIVASLPKMTALQDNPTYHATYKILTLSRSE
jgi:hypothetical protein